MQGLNTIGEFIREQRTTAKVSLRQLAAAAGVSNPYLSQIERGLRKPSAEILQQIAKGLRISAETLYIQAGILTERDVDSDVEAAILHDARLAERQKQVLLEIYRSFCRETAQDALASTADDGHASPAQDAHASPAQDAHASTADDPSPRPPPPSPPEAGATR